MYKYKIDISKALSKRGITSSVIRENNLLGQATLQNFKNGGNVTLESLNVVCLLLRCQLSDIIEIEPTDEEKLKYF